ncbi:MAG: phosphomannomutase/phosphoglucomutase [Clostridiales bacterium]|nr:phosphomannomutase/phosphoglucomutase [Clostridiales bacterium]
MANYEILKSGTDIRGRAIPSDDKPATLTEEAVADLAAAFALWLTRRTGKPNCKIVIGRDCRLTGEAFTAAILNTLQNSGLELCDCGMFSTPTAFLVTQFPSVQADGSIMITASHHPKDINGLKFFTKEGGVNSAELDEIIAIANAGEKIESNEFSSIIKRDCMKLYCDMLVDVVRSGTALSTPLDGMKIVVDAGHGVGGFFAERVLQPLGADISGSQFLEPDGNFPAHAPNPENKEAIESLKERVLEVGADLGVIFDADADRSAIVAADGTEINRSALIALAAAITLPDNEGATIVTDSVTTEGLKVFIESLGGVQHRYKRGYRNVIDEAKRIGAPLAIESSGHAAFAEHYYLDDGAYFIVKILVTMAALRAEGKDITDLIADYREPLDQADVRLNFTTEDFKPLAEKITYRLQGVSERLLNLTPDSYEGVRAYVPHADGYFIVRTSVHDPVMPIYIESDKPGGVLSIARFLYSFLFGFRGLDCTPLVEFIAQKEEEYAAQAAEEEYAEQSTDEESADGQVGEDYIEEEAETADWFFKEQQTNENNEADVGVDEDIF